MRPRGEAGGTPAENEGARGVFSRCDQFFQLNFVLLCWGIRVHGSLSSRGFSCHVLILVQKSNQLPVPGTHGNHLHPQSATKLGAVFTRGHAAIFLKDFTEVLARIESGRHCDVIDSATSIHELFTRNLNAVALKEIIRREAGRGFEDFMHSRAAEAEMGGNVWDLHRIGVMGSEEGLSSGGDLGGIGLLAGFQQAACFDDDEANRCAQGGLDLCAGVALFVLPQELGETRDECAHIGVH